MTDILSTDPLAEIFPIVDQNDNVIGQTTRQDANNNPHIIHRSVNIIIYDKYGKLLIQKRSLTKDTYPNTWAIGVGGHVNYGDEYLSSAIREIFEEIGVTVDVHKLQPIGKILIDMPNENEFSQNYEYHSVDELVIHPNSDEVAETKFVSVSEMKSMLVNPSVKWNPFTPEFPN